ncbi:TonB-dependent receptor [Acidithiobacillus sp. CV18-2]|uniref:TonB-dependent receptor n=1 Tax=Igneacidithiobacillus copahuensis TaxID=2724909 RepID=A0AAE2YQL1_9PROT|nr:TonB-dependent receptor [Igneacidithiobacillus copahuensis]MBU2753165.1 TonB-dependent receptor [Acidithiobacillus sp. CV18-3]MBU2756687.1 TonB-dependent receptor [Acidithiobacillus sp. BN09-2]MBU2776572.1 TonB-dependent receptor [Acidithiobacillus sp. CV18-2]MBU2796945.1 TonB-dependent receptor [Acidithiobacillus sp. VAN18-2]MBU2798173.1 TonB-dependent receptor [Acidithiobacillus sp. VAN18-4]UTV80428.1 TonB-dependent receptor [Acidithiobacillus sp. YTS05]
MKHQSGQTAPSVRGKVVWMAVLSAVSALYMVQARAGGEAPVGTVTADAQSAATVTNIAGVKRIAPPEKAVTSVSKKTVDHASPAQNFQSVLKHVPGMNVISQGPGNLSATDNEFTYQGFTSSQMASNFDGVPIINVFRGGVGGTGDDHAFTPLTMGQISTVKVFSGANQPSQNGINSLGGTISYEPALPEPKFYIDLDSSGGKYGYRGGNYTSGFAVNSGTLPGTGTEMLFKYAYTHAPSFLNNVYANINSYYAAIVQPYNNGLSQIKLVAVYNNEQARQPTLVPLALIDKYGRSYQPPLGVAYSATHTHALNVILSWKSLLNEYMMAKTKVFIQQQSANRTSFTSAAYYDPTHYGYAIYDGYPVGTNLEPWASPPSTNNSYDPTALFGSGVNGTQYHNYIDDIQSVGFLPSVSFFAPHNTVELGALVDYSQDHSAEYWYGSSPVPNIDGYNNAWNEHDTRNFNYVYLQDNIDLLDGKLHVYPGLKYNIVNTGCDDIAGYYYTYGGHVGNSYFFWEPSLGFSYTPIHDVNLFFSVGKTNKVPNISAYYSAIGATPTPAAISVKPEGDISYDFGVRYSGSAISGSLSFFRRNFTNIFSEYYDSATGQTFEYNNGAALYQGATLGLEVPVADHVGLFGTYNYTSAKYATLSVGTNGTSYPGEYRPYVPTYTATAGVRYQNGGLYAALTGHFVGRQYMATNKGQTIGLTLPAYDTLDFSASYEMPLHWDMIKSVKFGLYADNILNNNYLVYAEQMLKPYSYLQGQAGAPVFVGGNVRVRFD